MGSECSFFFLFLFAYHEAERWVFESQKTSSLFLLHWSQQVSFSRLFSRKRNSFKKQIRKNQGKN